MAREKSFVEDVEAVVHGQDANVPPTLVFSFPGLEDPLVLWDRLREIGWVIPERPPHPPPEIDWNSPGGSRYHVLPYRVDDFPVTPEAWPPDEVAERGLETINLLRRMGVDLDVPVAYLASLRRVQVETRGSAKPRRKERSTRVPRTILFSKQPFSSIVDEESMETYETAASPQQPQWYWSESNRHAHELCRSEDARTSMLESVAMGWELASAAHAPPTVDGRDRVLRFLVQDVQDGEEMIEMLNVRIGEEQCASLLMRPIERTGAFDNCLLVIAAVPKNRFAEIGQEIIDRFPDAIGRGRRYQAATGESAA